jgi:flap endonuclease-1
VVRLSQFIDVCILCGCDYCDTIKGIGPKTALKLVKEHGTIEAVLASLDKEKYPIPADFDFVSVCVCVCVCVCGCVHAG